MTWLRSWAAALHPGVGRGPDAESMRETLSSGTSGHREASGWFPSRRVRWSLGSQGKASEMQHMCLVGCVLLAPLFSEERPGLRGDRLLAWLTPGEWRAGFEPRPLGPGSWVLTFACRVVLGQGRVG